MEILFVTSELAPYSPSSGVADAAAALPKALRGLGHRVTVLSPLYPHIDPRARSLARRLSTFSVEAMGKTHVCNVYDGRTTGGVDLVFLANAEAFGSTETGAASGDAEQRALAAVVLGSAAAQLASKREPAPEILHAMGAGAGLALAYSARLSPALPRVLSLTEPPSRDVSEPLSHALLEALGADARSVFPEAQASALGAAIAAADLVVANSASGASVLAANGPQEASSASAALHALLAAKGARAAGIVNGIDSSIWNPLTDSNLSGRFDPVNLQGKTRCKGSVQYTLGLAVDTALPLISVIGELSSARGVDRVNELAQYALRNDFQLAVLHTNDEAHVDRGLAALAETRPEHIALRSLRASNEGADKLLHLALAGSDFLLLPLREARGVELGLAALRYGTLPIARPVGVLADTLVDADAKLETGNAFIIDEDTPESLLATAQRALAAIHRGEAFDALRRRVMRTDVSWERTARKYEHAFKQLAKKPAEQVVTA